MEIFSRDKENLLFKRINKDKRIICISKIKKMGIIRKYSRVMEIHTKVLGSNSQGDLFSVFK